MNKTNDGGVLGRVIALFLIVGAAYGARAISRGSFGCGIGAGHCCTMDERAEPAPVDAAAPAAAPAKAE